MKNSVGNKKVKLSGKEYALLSYFVENYDQVLSKEQITIRIWGYDTDVEYNKTTVHILFLIISPFYSQQNFSIYDCFFQYKIRFLPGFLCYCFVSFSFFLNRTFTRASSSSISKGSKIVFCTCIKSLQFVPAPTLAVSIIIGVASYPSIFLLWKNHLYLAALRLK